jgi:hypothetical protein
LQYVPLKPRLKLYQAIRTLGSPRSISGTTSITGYVFRYLGCQFIGYKGSDFAIARNQNFR